MPITAQELLDQAAEETGLNDFGDDWFIGPLAAYAADLDAPHLSDWGKAFLTRLVSKDLARRLQIIDCLRQHPEIEETPIPPILYITGHERSGTTLLHNLLSQHRDARFLSRWELMAPTPPPEPGSLATDPRRAAVQASVDALRGSDLEYMHWVNADEPEECVWGLMDCNGLLGMAVGLIMPSWLDWLGSHDFAPSLANYRKIVQILTWKNPVPEGGFLALKAPQMASYLPQFFQVFPDTQFIYIHRDPYRVLQSFTTLVEVVDGPFLKDRAYLQDLEEQQHRSLKRMGQLFDNLEAFEKSHPERVINAQYADLLASPVEEITRLFSQTSQKPDQDLPNRIEKFLAVQRAGSRARPRSRMMDFGYNREQVENYPPIAHYLQRYGVHVEERRQTGA
jgi:hypothetical protein